MNDFLDQLKQMDKSERRSLLEKLSSALTPEQQEQVRTVMQDKKQMEKITKNLRAEDLDTLVEGVKSSKDTADFLKSPQVTDRLRELLQ